MQLCQKVFLEWCIGFKFVTWWWKLNDFFIELLLYSVRMCVKTGRIYVSNIDSSSFFPSLQYSYLRYDLGLCC